MNEASLRILWVKVGGLWPLNTGGRLRTFHTIAELSQRHEVTVVTTHLPGDDDHALAAQLPACARVISLPHAPTKVGSAAFVLATTRSWLSPLPLDVWRWRLPAVRQEVDRLLATGRVDLCVADFLVAVPNVPMGGPVPVVLFEHNVEHVIWKRLAQAPGPVWRRALLELEWRKMRRFEAAACTQADLTLAVSEADRRLLAATAPAARVAAVETGVDIEYFAPNGWHEKPATIVFTGSLDWYPNEDAVLHFVNEILPRVRAEVDAARFVVVGRHPSLKLRAAAEAAGAIVTGTVDDVRPYLAEAAVCVVPLRIGGGTRLKIFEALAMARPVVSTTIGAEGLPVTPGEHLVLADGPEDFARAVVALLRDPARGRALAAAGRALVEQRFSWGRVALDFETRCRTAVEERSHAHA
ncbi:MAG TPA: glycosyltransferase [Candidatus Limnocylindria bacterium]|nr:glycosyltransferase [Candidatus Limnocylindria bacterium]